MTILNPHQIVHFEMVILYVNFISKKREQLMTRNKLKNQKVINTIKTDEKIANDVIGSDDSVGDDFRLSG